LALNKNITQELHLNFFKTDTSTMLALTCARVKTEVPGLVAFLTSGPELRANNSRIASNAPTYTAGLDRGVLPMGDWSTKHRFVDALVSFDARFYS
jgi:hypothetical protein